MRSWRGAALELLLALAAGVGCVLSWLAASTTVAVPPVLEGEPMTTSVMYSPPFLTLSLLLATVAGVLVVIAVARLASGGRAGSAAAALATDQAGASDPSAAPRTRR